MGFRKANDHYIQDGTIESLVTYAAENNMSFSISFYPAKDNEDLDITANEEQEEDTQEVLNDSTANEE